MVDEKDRAIIEALREEGDASTRAISEKTGIPSSTVHQRKKSLEERGIIKKHTVVVDDAMLGYTFKAYVLIAVDLGELRADNLTQDDLVDMLEEIDEVFEASIITGSFDILLSVKTTDKDTFNTVLQEEIQVLNGVSDTKTMLVL